MKILICNKNLKKTYTGTSRNVYEQIRYFVNKGAEVHVAGESIDETSLISVGAVPHKTFRVPFLSGHLRRQYFSLQCDKIREKLSPDLVIGHGDYQNPDIHCIHNNVHLAYEKIYGKPLPSRNEMYKVHTPIFAEKKFKHIIANSKLAKNDLTNRFKIPEDKISVIYPAFDNSKFNIIPSSIRNNIRRKIDVYPDDILIGLITSGDFEKRGLDIFLNVIVKLDEKITEKLKILLIGERCIPEKYISIVKGSNIYKKISLLPIQKDIENYFNALDIFVHPARIEEFGRVVLEAMACGCPVITNTNVGASELIISGKEHCIYSSNDEEMLKSHIQDLICNPKLRQQLSESNHQQSKLYSENNTYKYFDKLFNSNI